MGIEALRRQPVQGGLGDLQFQPLLLELGLNAPELDPGHGLHVLAGQGPEDHHLVEAVQEFRAEVGMEGLLDRGLGLRRVPARIEDGLAAQVGRHEHHGVAEIDSPPLAVREAAVLEHLEEEVEGAGVGLLHFVEEDDGVGAAADGLGEAAPLLVAHIAGRGPDEARGVGLVGELAHVDADQGILVVEEEFRQGPGDFGLAHARGAQEEEAPDGPLGIAQARPVAAEGIADGRQGRILAHHALAEAGLHLEQFLHLALQDPAHGNAGPAAHDGGDVGLAHLQAQHGTFLRGGRRQLFLQGRDLAVFQAGGPLVFALQLGLFQLDAQVIQLLLEAAGPLDHLLLVLPLGAEPPQLFVELSQFLFYICKPGAACSILLLREGMPLQLQLHFAPLPDVDLRGPAVQLHPHGAGRLVHEVHGLVRQEAVGDVAVAQLGRRHQGRILDAHAVVQLVALLQAAQDGDGVLYTGLLHEDRLEAALQGGVLLDVFPVFVQGGGADAAQLAAGQGGLQQVGRVHAAGHGPGAHQQVQLVDEEHDLPFGLLDFLDDALQALLELAPVLGAGHQGAHVQAHDAQTLQALRNIALVDALGQALHDGGLAHAGLADEHGVVLGAPRQHLQHPADLLVPADDRIQLPGGGQGRVVLGVLLQAGELLLGLLVLDLGALAALANGGFQGLPVQAEALQHSLRIRMGIGQGQQQGVRGQEAVAQPPPGIAGHLQEVPEGRTDLGLGPPHGPGQLREEGLGGLGQALDGLRVQAGPLQERVQSGLGREQGPEQMLGHQFWMLVLRSPLPGRHQCVVGLLGEGKEGHGTPRIPGWIKYDIDALIFSSKK